MLLVIILIIIVILLILLIKKQYSYWNDFSIPSVESKFPFGNLEPVAKKEKSFGATIYDIYKDSKDQILGIYLFFKPAILIRDPVIIKNIFTTDFNHFHDRGVYVDTKRDPMSGNLFSLEGEDWKNLRTKLTPAFTSGKLKGMFESIKGIGDNLIKYLQSEAAVEAEIDIRDIASRYVADCLALTAFGQNISTIDNPNHEFRMNGVKLNSSGSIVDVIRRTALFLCPSLIKFLRLGGLPKFMKDFCLNMVTETVQYRESQGIVSKDLMQFLIQLRNNSSSDSDDWNIKATAKGIKSLSYEQIAGNVFIFYIAGTESSTSTIAYLLYELTQNEELLERAKADIQETLQKHDGNITYESIMDMKFIDNCVKEVLRKYPGLPILSRECARDYKLPNMDFVIKKGTSVIVSLLGISRDEKFFSNPEKFDPDRFTRMDFNEDMYMPFGIGPRHCLAFRMGLLIVKVAVVMLLMNFKWKAVRFEELEFDTNGVSLLPKKGKCVIKIMKKDE